MSEKKLPHCSASDEPQHGQPPNAAPGCRNQNESGQRNGDAASSSPESGSLNGDVKRSGKSRRRRKRSSNPESRSDGKVDSESASKKSRPPSDPQAVLMGLRAECANVWFEHSVYERAESLYQRWLAGAAHGTSGPSPARDQARVRPAPPPPRASGPACLHPEQVACHHVVQAVWVNKPTFDQAERRFVEGSAQSVPDSLDLASPSRTPDEGYQSLAPTPATPATPVTPAVPPASRQSINGLPRFPVELLRDVWLEKPLYDRAEAAFYQNLYGNNSTKRPGSASSSRSSEHPQCLVEEEEEQDEEEMVVEEARVVQLGKAEVFHALHPIQEEEEPAEVQTDDTPGSGACHFLHPDSERVWLDRWQYDAAESRFHGYRGSKAAVVKKSQRPGAAASSVASSTSLRDNTMSAVDFLAREKIWFDKPRYDEAERRFYERMNGGSQAAQTSKDAGANSILQDIARARENIQKSLAGLKTSLSSRGSDHPSLSPQFQLSSSGGGGAADQEEIVSRIKSLELENQSLHKVVEDLRAALSKLECRVAVLEKCPAAVTPALAASVPYTNGTTVQQKSSAPVEEEEDDDDDIDLFGSDDEEAEKLKEQRLKAYAEKKAKKPVLIAKSSILLDVKPWDDETDMGKLEECVRSVQADGLLWGTSKLVPVGYGIKKLQIACVVEDDKVGTDMLEEEITKFEDYVQSVDVAAFNKI